MTEDKVNWKAMYLHLARATEQSIRILIEAQQECERLYIEQEQNNE